MSQSKKNYCPLAENFPDAFAYCRTVLDCTGNPVKYIILDVNKAFEALTGITRSKLLGSEIVKVLKIIENTGAGVGFDWKGLFDKIFLNRKTARPELNLKLLDRWYEVTAYLDTKDNLITIFRDITSYKLTEKELQEKKQHLKKLLNSLDEGVWSHSLPDGRQLFDNLACEKIFGRPYKDFLHDPSLYERVIHPDDQNRNFVSEVIKKKKLVHKYRIFRPDGELRWLECKSWVTENEAGIPSRLEGIFRDITEQKLAEEALRKSEEKYRLLLENAHEAIVIAQDGMHKYVNPSAVRLFGYTKDELLSRSIDTFFHPDDRHIIIERHYKRLQGKKISGRATYRIITKSSQIRLVEHFNILIEWEGQPATLAFMLDMTKRKQAEETLKESEDKFRYIADFSPLPLSIISEEGIFEYINPKFIEVFGYTLADIPTSKKWFELAFPNPLYRRQMINDFKNNIKKTGKNIVVPETGRVTCKDGSEKEILFRPVLMDNGKFLVICEDITKRKLTEAKLRYLSFNDSLTGLYNRAFFEEEIKRLDTARQLPLSIIIGDINGLKLVNDTFGHREGDNFLQKIARILENACRSEDIICRWGGDEFAILLPKTCEKTSEKICKRIKDACIMAEAQPIPFSISLGTATKTETEQSMALVIKEAEDKMYRNKLMESKSARSYIITSLQKSLAEKTNETKEHAERLQEYAQLISQDLSLSGGEQNELKLLAALHDIGKIAVTDSLLTKPGALTPEEWKVMRKHPEIGYRIAQALPDLAHVANKILAHHEHWDGTGYPSGLKGEEIPLLSRIIAVVDAYDVMINGRPYQKKMSKAEAIKELKRCSGTQFDPSIVSLFIDIISDKKSS